MASIARLVVSLGASTASFETDMKRAANVSKRELRKMERQAEQLNKQWNRNFQIAGAAVVGALGLAVKKAAEFEKAMAEVSTLLDDTSSIERTSEAVKDLSVQFGTSAVDQAKALYQIISAGASDAASQMEQLTAANKLAIGGVTDVMTAADGLTSVLNAYAGTGLDATRVSDIMFATMRRGKTTIGELSSSMGQVVSIAAQTGVSFEELGAGIATITASGLSTSQAVTGLRGVLTALLQQTDKTQEAAKELSIEFDVARLKAVGLDGILKDIANSGATETQLSALVGQIEGLNAIMAAARNNGEAWAANLDATTDSAGQAEKAFSTMAEKTAFKADQARFAIERLSIEVGEKFLAAISDAAVLFVKHIDDIAKAIEALVIFITTRATIAVVASFAKMAASAKGAATAMAFLGGVVGVATTALGSVGLVVANNLQAVNRYKGATEGLVKTLEDLGNVADDTASLTAAQVELTQSAADATERLLVVEERMAKIRSGIPADQEKYHAELQQLIGEYNDLQFALHQTEVALEDIGRSIQIGTPKVEGLGKGLDKVGKSASNTKKQIKELEKAAEKFLEVAQESREEVQKHIREFEAYHDRLQDLRDIGDPVAAMVRRFGDNQRFLNDALRKGHISAAEYQRILNVLSHDLGRAAAATIEVEETTNRWAEAMLEAVRILERSFTSAWENIVSGAENAFDGILDGFKTLLASMLHKLTTAPLLKELTRLFEGEITAGQFDRDTIFSALGGAAGVGLGSLLGGGGVGASLGSGLGSLLGSAFATKFLAGLGSFAGPIGTVIGGILGGMIGGLFDDAPDFELQLVGSGLIGDPSLQGRTGPFANTALGGFNITNVGDFEAGDIEKFVQGIVDFDNAFAQFLDAGQLEQVTDLLKQWGIELDGAAVTLENFIGSRLDQIQFALDGAVRAWVDSAQSLEEEIARTGVAFLTESLFRQQPDLFANRTQQDFLNVVEAFQTGTKTITEAFEEVIRILDAVISATTLLKDFSTSDLVGDYEALVRLQNETPLESLTRQYMEAFDAIAAFSGSPDQLFDIANRIQSIRAAEIAALQQIDAIQKGINSNLDRLRQDILNVFEGPKTGRQLFTEAAGLVDLVAQAETPEEIAALADQFDALIRQFSQEDVARIGDTLVSLIDRFQQASNDSLDRIRQSTIDSAQSMRDIADAFLTSIPDALALIAASNEDAAAALIAIANGTAVPESAVPAFESEVTAEDIFADSLDEQAGILRDGTNMMSDALRDGSRDMASNIAAAIQSGFSLANVRVTVVIADDGRITQ